MKEIRIGASKEYSVYVASGTDSISFLMDKHKVKRVFILTDERVYNLYGSKFKTLAYEIIGIKVIKPGEDSKSIDVVMDIYKELVNCGADRKTVIAAVGGGVVGDIAGFAASTFMRGMELIQIPTTLMAQCDSSIGGKNGFNFMNLKNAIGTFYQPVFVFSNVNFIKTLDESEYKSGLAEVIKYGFIKDENLFNYIENNREAILQRENDKLIHLVHECARIKGEIVEKDEFDTGLRHLLNFGHTIGHGVEGASNFNISHGAAVAAGMIMESQIAVNMGKLDEKSMDRLIGVLKFFNLYDIKSGLDKKKIFELVEKDKKKTGGNIKMPLPIGVGNAIITSEVTLEHIKGVVNKNIRI